MCAVLFDFREVDIVDENDDALIGSCTEDGFGFFVEFGLDGELGFFRFCFGREVEENSVDAFLLEREEVWDDE